MASPKGHCQLVLILFLLLHPTNGFFRTTSITEQSGIDRKSTVDKGVKTAKNIQSAATPDSGIQAEVDVKDDKNAAENGQKQKGNLVKEIPNGIANGGAKDETENGDKKREERKEKGTAGDPPKDLKGEVVEGASLNKSDGKIDEFPKQTNTNSKKGIGEQQKKPEEGIKGAEQNEKGQRKEMAIDESGDIKKEKIEVKQVEQERKLGEPQDAQGNGIRKIEKQKVDEKGEGKSERIEGKGEDKRTNSMNAIEELKREKSSASKGKVMKNADENGLERDLSYIRRTRKKTLEKIPIEELEKLRKEITELGEKFEKKLEERKKNSQNEQIPKKEEVIIEKKIKQIDAAENKVEEAVEEVKQEEGIGTAQGGAGQEGNAQDPLIENVPSKMNKTDAAVAAPPLAAVTVKKQEGDAAAKEGMKNGRNRTGNMAALKLLKQKQDENVKNKKEGEKASGMDDGGDKENPNKNDNSTQGQESNGMKSKGEKGVKGGSGVGINQKENGNPPKDGNKPDNNKNNQKDMGKVQQKQQQNGQQEVKNGQNKDDAAAAAVSKKRDDGKGGNGKEKTESKKTENGNSGNTNDKNNGNQSPAQEVRSSSDANEAQKAKKDSKVSVEKGSKSETKGNKKKRKRGNTDKGNDKKKVKKTEKKGDAVKGNNKENVLANGDDWSESDESESSEEESRYGNATTDKIPKRE